MAKVKSKEQIELDQRRKSGIAYLSKEDMKLDCTEQPKPKKNDTKKDN